MVIMNLPKAYTPGDYEADIYSLWEQTNTFAPKGEGEPFSIVMPPPNANGNAHMGTAITLFLEDIAVRYQRLRGKKVLYVPGADHAGFETQVVYEKELAKQGKSRFDFKREELYGQIWDFVAQNRGNFEAQFRRFGTSCDWNEYTFTLDQKVVGRAYQTFKKLWDDGLVYRGERLVNFCTHHGTAFADIEVAYKEEKSSLWEIRYPLVEGEGEIIVATTRPETMLGDVAVAVNPNDERYKDLVGKTVKLPLSGREIPIIADDFVDTAFGTGAVKITPAHDINDYDASERHNLPKLTVIDHEGKITGDVPETYKGLPVLEARVKIVADLTEQGYLVKTEEYTHNVGHCYKCGTVLQPLLRDQWFVDMESLAKPAIEALKAGKITFHPDTKREQLISYLENLRDWNISRQIVWGIPIPAFQNTDDSNDWIFNESVDQEQIEVDGKTYRRDPDVFDTWFSSSSWPYATLGYPDSQDKAEFYPNSLLETGGEILYPWVSRMIMLGLYVTGDVPFKSVYIHGYVMAADGSKMSKSLGNVVNPIPVIDTYGADALRMGLIAGRAPAVNRGYDERRIEEARNFCNKLWNVARYIEHETGENVSVSLDHPNPSTPADHWILSKLQQSQANVEAMLDDYRFSEASEEIYHFVHDYLADWYIEASKSQQNPSVLAWVLQSLLHIAHPFAPFVTETIWQTLKMDDEAVSVLASGQWPTTAPFDSERAAQFELLKAVIGEVREISSGLGILHPEVRYYDSPIVAANDNVVAKLCRVRSIEEATQGQGGLKLTGNSEHVWLDLSESELQAYHVQLDDKKAAGEASMKLLEGRLSNDSYIQNAPEHLVAETRQKLEETKELLESIEESYKRFA